MAQSYENLNVWKQAIDFAVIIYGLSKKFPKDEQFGIISQIRRAVVSISSNIAEGSSRKSSKDFIRFIDISIGSLNEVESLLEISFQLEYLTKAQFSDCKQKLGALGSSLGGFRKYLFARFGS